MSYTLIINNVSVLFLIMGVGIISTKRNIITPEISQGLSKLLVTVIMPLRIISSFQMEFSRELLMNAGIVFAASIGIHLISILLAEILFKRVPFHQRNVLKMMTVFANSGYMGFPILQSLFGDIGFFYGSIYLAGLLIFLWTYGVVIFIGKVTSQNVSNVLKAPAIPAVTIGLLLFIFSIKLPPVLFKTFSSIGSMTTPMMMLIIGSLLSQINFKTIFSGAYVYIGSLLRLVVVPLLSFFLLRFAGISGIPLQLCVICAATPAAANTAIFASRYDGDTSLASRAVSVSTLLSIITLMVTIILVAPY